MKHGLNPRMLVWSVLVCFLIPVMFLAISAGSVTAQANQIPTVQPSATFLPTYDLPATLTAVATTWAASPQQNADWTPVQRVIGRDQDQMMLVPTGCFMMGGTVPGETTGEEPTEVCFDEPFWIDRFEVTNGHFSRFGGAAEHGNADSDPNKPRVDITYFEAAAFCESRGGRLPTQAEWEYAARGPDSLLFPWGNEFDPENVVYAGNADGPAFPGSRVRGMSWVGAHDMSGNVWEWINCGWANTLATTTSTPENERGDRYCPLRGGSWADGDVSLYPLYPMIFVGAAAVDRDQTIGFRCVLDLNQ